MQQLDKQREAFEAWWFNGDYAPSPHKRMSIYDEDAFEIWQAALQSVQVNHIVETTEMGRQVEHNLKDVRCECCGYMTYHREHMGCIRAASHQAQWQPIEGNLPSCKESAIEYLVFDTLNNKVGHDYWMVPDDGSEPFWNHYGEYVSHWMPLPQGPNVVD